MFYLIMWQIWGKKIEVLYYINRERNKIILDDRNCSPSPGNQKVVPLYDSALPMVHTWENLLWKWDVGEFSNLRFTAVPPPKTGGQNPVNQTATFRPSESKVVRKLLGASEDHFILCVKLYLLLSVCVRVKNTAPIELSRAVSMPPYA